jgi:hypothetical protein
MNGLRTGREIARWLRIGSLAAIALGVLRLATSGWLPSWTCWLALAAAAVIGWALSLRHRASFAEAASRVDRVHGWNDTLTTAWHVSRQPSATCWGQQVLARAVPLLDRISPGRVAPLRFGRTAATACIAVFLAIALSLCPTFRLPSAAAPPEPALPPDALVAVPDALPPADTSPQQIMASLHALDPPSPTDPAAQGRLAVIQDHAIVRDYFRRQADLTASPAAAP